VESYSDRARWRALAILFLVSVSSFFDRYVVSVVLEPIKAEFRVSDTMLGLLTGPCFALFYALAGLPVARWADRGDRPWIIALAVSLWSVMTLWCGVAATFWQLALARAGVGVGESGTIPPTQSLIADLFPPERRTTAVAIVISASTAGYLLGLGVGGYVTEQWGWRVAFLVAGAPGLALALLVGKQLPEPRRLEAASRSRRPAESWRTALAHLWRKRSYLSVLISSQLFFAFTYAMGFFAPSYLVRVLHEPLGPVSLSYGSVEAAANLLGTLVGGYLTDRWSKRDIRVLCWLPGAGFIAAGLVYVAALGSSQLRGFLLLDFVASVLQGATFPALFSIIHAICGSRRRATAIAVVLFSATLFGAGVGPIITGALSDSLSVRYGEAGLRYSLMIMMTTLVVAGVAILYGGKAIKRDLES